MKAHRSIVRSLFAVLAATLLCPATGEAQEIPSPEEFFGHQMGADRQLARWDRLVEYYDTLGVLSDRLIVEHVGCAPQPPRLDGAVVIGEREVFVCGLAEPDVQRRGLPHQR